MRAFKRYVVSSAIIGLFVIASQYSVSAQNVITSSEIQANSVIFVFKPAKKFSGQTSSPKRQQISDNKKNSKPVKKVSPASKTGNRNAAVIADEPIAPEEWINEGADYAIEERKISDSEPFLSLTNGFLNTRYQFCASPQFPNAARKAKQKLVQSEVLVTVAKYGGVLDAKTLKGDPSFRAAVYETLTSMRFRDSYFMGQKIRIEGLLSFSQNPKNEIVCNTAPQEVEIPTIIDGGDIESYAKTCEAPSFPSDAKNLKSVSAKVQVVVNEEGKVVDAKLIEGHPAFGQAAVKSAMNATFPRSMITTQYVKVRGFMNFTQTPDNGTKCSAV